MALSMSSTRLSQIQQRSVRSPVVSRAALGSLPSRVVRGVALPAKRQLRRSAPRTVTVRAESTPEFTLGESSGGYAGILAVAGYVAVHFNKLHVDSGLLLKAIATYTAVSAVITLVTGKNLSNVVGTVVGPASLAAYALAVQHITFLDTVTAFSGYYLAEQLEPRSLFWGYVATLAAALYYNKGTLWYAVAAGGVAAFKLFRAYENKETVPVFNIAILAASAWAVYKHQAALWAILLYLGHTAWGLVGTGRSLVDSMAN